MKGVHQKFLLILTLLVLSLPTVFAHVSYVLEDEELERNLGQDLPYLKSALFDQVNFSLIIGTIVVVFILYFFLMKNRMVLKELKYIKKEASTYDEFIPWIARLGLGIALIGAGSSGVLISPTFSSTLYGSVQIFLGFLLMAGFLTSLATWASVALFFVGLSQQFYFIGNLDFLGLCLAILILAEPKPGVDDLFGIPFFFSLKGLKKYFPLIMRLSIGIAMTFLALYEKLLNPHISRLVVEQYELTSAIPVSAAMWVLSAGLIELLVGLLLIIGFRVRLVSAIAFMVLSTSFFYFNEAVFSHITLFAMLSILFIIGQRKVLHVSTPKKPVKRKKRR